MMYLSSYEEAIQEFNEHIAAVQLRHLRKKIATTLKSSEPKTPRHLLASQLREIEWEKYIQTPISSPQKHAPPQKSCWQLETPYEEICEFLAWVWHRQNNKKKFYTYKIVRCKIERVDKYAFKPFQAKIMSICLPPPDDLPEWREWYGWAMQQSAKFDWVKPEILINKFKNMFVEAVNEFAIHMVVIGKHKLPANLDILKNEMIRLPEKMVEVAPAPIAPEKAVKIKKSSKNNKLIEKKPQKIAEKPQPISYLPKCVYADELALIQAAWLQTTPRKIELYWQMNSVVLPPTSYIHQRIFSCLAAIEWGRYLADFRQPESECVAEIVATVSVLDDEISSFNQIDNPIETNSALSELAQELQKLKQENQELLDLLHLNDEEMKMKDNEISQLKQKIINLQAANKKNTPTEVEGKPLLQYGQEADLYDDEILSFVRQTLELSLKNQTHENSRYQHILLDLLKANPLPHDVRIEKNEALRNAMRTYTRMDNPTRQALINIGFTITEDGAHYKLVFMDDGRYTCTTSKTSSDNRAGKNFARDVGNLLF